MSKSTTTDTNFLAYTFNSTAFPWNDRTSVQCALHTSDPLVSGNQTSNEATYPGYARVSVLRNSANWTVSGASVQNNAIVAFPQCGAGSNTVTHVSLGTDATGAGQILYYGALNTSLSVTNLVVPQFPVGALIIQET